ncbi:MAG TPA: molybdopterin-binding protein [Blastocatellia bacterium]
MASMRMRTAAIIVIGNEILNGKSRDKNAAFLISELRRLGVALSRITVIPDDLDDIARTVSECAARFDYIFTSGGVGPTHDDLTIEGIARAFGRRVIRHPDLERMLRSYFGADIDETRLRMADMPEGGSLIREGDMRWPVLAIENVYILPGVPELFRSKFEAISHLFQAEPFYACAIYTREDEFDIAPRLNRVAEAHTDVEIGSYPVFTEPDYRVKITIESKEAQAVERARRALLDALNPDSIVRTE